MTPQVRLGGPGGVWLSTLVPVGGVEVDARWPLGGYQLDFDVLLGSRQRPSVVAEGADCQLFFGGVPQFLGQVSEVDWDQGKVTATGRCRDAETAVALTSGNVPTTTLDVAIDAAIARGAWQVTRPASLSGSPVAATDASDNANYIAALADLWAGDNGKRWYVDPFGAARSGVDPTTPELYILPGAGELSWTTSEQASRIIGNWIDPFGVPRVSWVGSGSTERIIDLSNRGVLTSAQVLSILNAILAQSTSGGWAGGITVASQQIVTPGGLHPSLASVSRMVGRGLMIRLLGHRDPRPGRFALTTDVVTGQGVWNVDDGTVALTPLGSVARDFSAIVESFGGTVTQ